MTFAGVFFKSISILLSFSFQRAFDCAMMASKEESPTSLSAFAQAWSVETNETPTRRLICFGLPAYENSAPDS